MNKLKDFKEIKSNNKMTIPELLRGLKDRPIVTYLKGDKKVYLKSLRSSTSVLAMPKNEYQIELSHFKGGSFVFKAVFDPKWLNKEKLYSRLTFETIDDISKSEELKEMFTMEEIELLIHEFISLEGASQ